MLVLHEETLSGDRIKISECSRNPWLHVQYMAVFYRGDNSDQYLKQQYLKYYE